VAIETDFRNEDTFSGHCQLFSLVVIVLVVIVLVIIVLVVIVLVVVVLAPIIAPVQRAE
jgi:hypothetical protein